MTHKELVKLFKEPTVEYKGKPFWSWNGELNRDELIRQTSVMKEMGFGGHFMHSRAGLITEYMSDEWFDHINAIADESEKLGLEAWLYDEDRYPSGSAGGIATKDPKYRCKSIVNHEMWPQYFTWSDSVSIAFIAKIDGNNLWGYRRIYKNDVVDEVISEEDKKLSTKEGNWKVLFYTVGPYPDHPNFNNGSPLDTISREAVAKFIEVTHEKYREKCGDRLGRSIKGIFTDEPRRFDSIHFDFSNERERFASTCWTEELESEFQKRYGYSFTERIPELFYWMGGNKVAPIKLHYFNLTCDLFCENYAKQIQSWCRDNNMVFTGHGLEEQSLREQIICMGSIMRLYEYMDWPGMDELTESERKYWVAKQLASVVRQLDKPRMLSELYGCTGWQFNFRSHKTVGDWQALFGVNFRCHHLSWYTMEGQAKRDYPASIFHQSPWYKHYSKVEDYFNRYNVYNLEGRPACDLLVINPIESMFCQLHIGWHDWNKQEIASPECAEIEKKYREIFFMLTENHIDFDWGEEDIMCRHLSLGKANDGTPLLNIGKMSYSTVLISDMLTIRRSTVEMLREFIDIGGKVIIMGEEPKYCDAVKINGDFALSSGVIHINYDEKDLIDAVRSNSKEYISVTDEKGNALKDVFVQAKHNFDGGDAFVILNNDLENAKENVRVTFKTDGNHHVELWNFEDGSRYDYDEFCHREGENTVINTYLAAAQTKCFVLREEKSIDALPLTEYECVSEYTVSDAFGYKADEPNVCVLDFARYRKDDGEWTDETAEILKIDKNLRDEFKIMRRCEAMLQPWYIKKHGLDKEFCDVELKFEFEIESMPSGEIILVGERPEYNEYFVNGTRVICPNSNDFWIDICFKKMPIPKDALKVGKNEICVKTRYKFSTHLESVYLIGDFGVKAGLKKSVICNSMPEKLTYGSLSDQKMPFYSGNITYYLKNDMYSDAMTCADDEKIFISVKSMGAAVRINADEDIDEIIAWEPYEADVTDAVRRGLDINVTVLGTRKNTFGPLHTSECVVHRCGHGSFTTENDQWTDEYNLIEDGLREIKLIKKKSAKKRV